MSMYARREVLRVTEFEDLMYVTAYGKKLEDVVIDASEKFGPGARQSFKDECDINNILKKYQKTGVVDWLAKHEGTYADVSAFDFMSAQMTIVEAKRMFGDLPSSVRKRFSNDPAEFLLFMEDDSNLEEAIKLGLATRKVVEEPIVAAVAAPPVSSPVSPAV